MDLDYLLLEQIERHLSAAKGLEIVLKLVREAQLSEEDREYVLRSYLE